MFTVICDASLTEASNGEYFLRGNIVETGEGLEEAKGLRCQMWLENDPVIADFVGKGFDIQANPTGSFQIEGTPIKGLRLGDIVAIRELPADEVDGYKTAIAKIRLSNLLAAPNQVTAKRRTAPGGLAAAAASGEVAEVAPVATGADL